MFRWVVCQLETLRRSVQRNLRGIFEKLPKTLDETYERVLKDINEDNRDHARRLLHCLAVAIRPLRVEELAEILAFDFDDIHAGIPKFHAGWRWKDQEVAVLSTCSSLITVVDSSIFPFGKCRVVRFSHFSVKESLVSDRLSSSAGVVSRYHILPGPAHTILAQACLGSLLHLDIPTYWHTSFHFPLSGYAGQYWVEHAKFEDVASQVKDGMQSLFNPDKHHLIAWVGIYNFDHLPPYTLNPLYYAALCGFHALVEHLIIGHPHLINTVSGSFDFPVLAALSRKHIQVAEILLRCGGKVDIWGRLGRTVLQQSITPGVIPREDIVDVVSFLLKNGADVKFRGSDLSTPLHTAAYHLNSEVFQLLLESGADIDSRDDEGRIPLHVVNIHANRRESQARDVAQLLLKRGANVHAQDNDGATSLLEAAYRNYVDISQILLEHGAEPNAKNNDCETSLHRCLGNDEQGPAQYSLVRLLLGHGANLNDQDKDLKTPLHLAMRW